MLVSYKPIFMLFPETPKIILQKDGLAEYIPQFYSQEESKILFQRLSQEIKWKNDVVIIFGKKMVMNRLSAWYAEQALEYTYSKITRKAEIFNDIMLEIKSKIEKETGERFNSCLLNFYHSGNDGMGWHSDDENSMVKNSCIASLSLGESRVFHFKHNIEKTKVSISLENGSLLLMKNEIQQYWKHSLPKSKKVKSPRINLTFRKSVV